MIVAICFFIYGFQQNAVFLQVFNWAIQEMFEIQTR
jgi:hypothetical protein